jgi:hypothetical protein
LDTVQTATGPDRKTLIRSLAGELKRQTRQRERGRTYQRDVDQALRVIAERLIPNLAALAEQLAAQAELHLNEALRQQLSTVSISTVKRRLAAWRQDEPVCQRRAPQPPARMVQSIPMRRIAWNERQPGHFDVDLVHHAGPSAEGQYVHTLQMVDVATGWSERAAVLGRLYLGTSRLDTVLHTNRLNALYDRLWLYYNFFQPVLLLAEKEVTRTNDAVTIKRRFDQPQTPFERVCAAGVLATQPQQTLERLRQQTNPRQLRREIYALIDQIVASPLAQAGRTPSVHATRLPAGRWEQLPCYIPRTRKEGAQPGDIIF